MINANYPIQVEVYNAESFTEIDTAKHTNSVKNDNKVRLNIRTEHLNKEEKAKILELCKQYRTLFYNDGDQLSVTKGTKHNIILSDEQPIFVRPFRYSIKENLEIKKQVFEL